ncbi:uracil-DNA glycosylase [Neogemmobacter tilapiae]|nr:uracil-DNA glycosylase [Gemmobacter tilapiae]
MDALDGPTALALLEWQVEMGVTDVIGEASLDRYALTDTRPTAPTKAKAAPPPEPMMEQVDPVAVAKIAANNAPSLDALAEALAAYDHCEMKKGAKRTVFADGNPQARVMIIGEAPGRDEDIEGRPFVGRAGQLLDRMFAAIGLSRTSPDPATSLYITNVMPWRPPNNRDPEPAEVAMMQPFLARHVELIAPDLLVVMGNTPLFALTGGRGITRARGNWAQAWGKPLLPMLHPAYLLRNPGAKREAWADLLALQARLKELG